MLRISCIPTWEMENPMGYKGVWVIRVMGLEGVNCIVDNGSHMDIWSCMMMGVMFFSLYDTRRSTD